MKSTLFFCLLGIWLISSPFAATAQKNKTAIKNTRQLVWSDEFNYEGLPDPSKWGYEQGFIRGVDSQIYTQRRLENAEVKGGYLIITGRKEPFRNPNYSRTKKAALDKERSKANTAQSNPQSATVRKFSDSLGRYTSASVTTQGKAAWTYGRIEVKAQVPKGKGSWPAVWMLGTSRATVGWPECGEIDIMEHVGKDPSVIYANTHYSNSNRQKNGNRTTLNDPSAGFHVYAIEWDKDNIRFFVDDRLYHTFDINKAGTSEDNPFRKPFYLLINLALGGQMGGPIDDAALPGKFLIDYVRVYQ